MTGRRPIWKILTITAASLVVLLGIAGLWIRSIASDRQAAMEERLKALDSELRAPVLVRRPGSDEGDAWDDYVLALTEASKVKSSDKLIGILANTSNADHAFGGAALAAHGATVDHLVRGTRRASCSGATNDLLLRHWQTVVRLALLKARSLQKDGKTKDAFAIHLVLGQFGRDVAEGSSLYTAASGLMILEQAFEALRDDLSLPEPGPEIIGDLESRLALLEESFPRPDQSRRRSVLVLGENFPYRLGQSSAAFASLSCWRFGFSSRLMAATNFLTWDRCFRRSMEADRLPWPQAQSLIASLRSELEATTIPEPYSWPSMFLEDGARHRSALTHLRLLRMAARYRRTGEILELDDPFGGKLLHQASGGRLRVWSVGKDGVDQKGLGNWDSRPIEDIVLEVPR